MPTVDADLVCFAEHLKDLNGILGDVIKGAVAADSSYAKHIEMLNGQHHRKRIVVTRIAVENYLLLCHCIAPYLIKPM